jgi:hypothetical protein
MISMVRKESRGNSKEEILLVMDTSVMKICSISSSEVAEEVEDSSTSTFSMVDTNSNNKKRSYLTTQMLSSLI